jgi:lipoprotein-releasing system permease protein
MYWRERFELLIGLRYLRSGQRRGFLSFITVISMVGLMLGVAVLLVVMSVMNGFERELRTRILAVTSHATLMGLDGPLLNWHEAQAAATQTAGVRGALPYIEEKGMLAAASRLAGVQLRGIDPQQELQSQGLAKALVAGSLQDLQPGAYRIILGDALAEAMQVAVGGTVVLITAQGAVTPTGLVPRMRRFTVTGIFRSGMYEYDRGLALIHLQDAALLYRLGDAVTGIRLELDDPLQAPATVRQLAVAMGGGYYVSDWTRIHPNFFRSIQMTKSMLFVILSMIVAIAAFNIVATLVMVVKDKQADIAILRTLGAAPKSILTVFSLQGALIGMIGVGLGLALGAVVSLNLERLVHGLEQLTGQRFLDAKVYFMSDLPAQVLWSDVWKVGGVAILLCLLATVYPAWRAARTVPAEALRHD